MGEVTDEEVVVVVVVVVVEEEEEEEEVKELKSSWRLPKEPLKVGKKEGVGWMQEGQCDSR